MTDDHRAHPGSPDAPGSPADSAPGPAAHDWRLRLFDRYLDALAAGDPTARASPTIDRADAAFARLAFDLTRHDAAPARSDRRFASAPVGRIGTDRMPGPRPVLAAATATRPGPFAITPRSTIPASIPAPAGRALPRPRWRDAGQRGLGLVATLTLIALVGLSALAAVLTAPPRAPEPTSLAALVDATPTATSPAATPDILLPDVSTCDVPPRDRDTTLRLLEPYLSGRLDPPPLLIDPLTTMASAYPSLDVATQTLWSDRPPADDGTRTAIGTVWAAFQACQTTFDVLRGAALMTDDGAIRFFVPGSTPTTWDSPNHISDLEMIDHGPRAATPTFDRPATMGILAPRVLPDGRVAGLIVQTQSPHTSIVVDGPCCYGHVVFTQQGDRWLIDEISGWLQAAG